jgi:hypothetical protein
MINNSANAIRKDYLAQVVTLTHFGFEQNSRRRKKIRCTQIVRNTMILDRCFGELSEEGDMARIVNFRKKVS